MLLIFMLAVPLVGALALLLLPVRHERHEQSVRLARPEPVVSNGPEGGPGSEPGSEPISAAGRGFLPTDAAVRGFGAAVTGVTLLVALVAAVLFDPRHPERMQLGFDRPWAPAIGLRFHLGVDGISLPLVLLTALLGFLCALYTIKHPPSGAGGGASARLLTGLLLTLEVGMLGTFLALDLLLFFVFFEIVLIPMYVLIVLWGGPGRRPAAYKFILYTLLGSGLLLVGMLLAGVNTGTLDMVELAARHGAGLSHGLQVTIFLLIGLGLAVKAPMWPLHTWLPDAHTEAPTVGSVLLAGVLLKMGTYGLVRIAVPVAPEGAQVWAPWLGLLAVIGILYGSLACLAQRDLKRMIAYSSVGHMGFVLLGIATLTPVGLNAALFGNIAHGLITGLLFFLAGAVKERYGTGDLDALGGGMLTKAPHLGALLTFASVAGLGLPGLAGFWGEMLALLGAYQPAAGLPRETFVTYMVLAGIGAALTAAYFLRMLAKITHGRPATLPHPPASAPTSATDTTDTTDTAGSVAVGAAGTAGAGGAGAHADPRAGRTAAGPGVSGPGVSGPAFPGPAVSGHSEPDRGRVTRWEYAAWAPLIALTLLIGLWPKTLLDLTDAPVRALLGGG